MKLHTASSVPDQLLSPLQLFHIRSKAVQQSLHTPQRVFTHEHALKDLRCASAHFTEPALPFSPSCRPEVQLMISFGWHCPAVSAGSYCATSAVSSRHYMCDFWLQTLCVSQSTGDVKLAVRYFYLAPNICSEESWCRHKGSRGGCPTRWLSNSPSK